MAHQQVLSTRTLLGRVLLVATTICVSVAASSGRPARAASELGNGPQPPKPFPWGYGFGASQQGHPGNNPAGGRKRDVSDGTGGGNSSPAPPDMCGSFKFGIQACALPQIPGQPAPGGPPAISPAQLAISAWRRLLIPAPQVATAPPRGSDGLVGLAEWFWVQNWDVRSRRVRAGGVWAEVTARPASLTISPGSGQPTVRCVGPGRAYDGQRSASGQHSDCSYTYVRSSARLPGEAYQVTATVTWGGTWVGSGGTGGTLPALSRSSSFTVRVAEGQAVTE